MATSRRKTPGFTTPKKEEEVVSVEQLLDEIANEVFESVSQIESEVKPSQPKEEPFVEQEIIPTEDTGARFVEETTPSTPAAKPIAPQLQTPPKRHPRNIPKFSRYK